MRNYGPIPIHRDQLEMEHADLRNSLEEAYRDRSFIAHNGHMWRVDSIAWSQSPHGPVRFEALGECVG
jgi:hypothetical protein